MRTLVYIIVINITIYGHGRGGTDEEKWGKMGKNGEKIYGEFGSGRVKNSPFFTIFPHDFFGKFGQYKLAYPRNLTWTLSLAHF